MPPSRFAHDIECAREAGEIVPSLVYDRFWTNPLDGRRWRGRYEARYIFTPYGAGPFGDGERFCCKPGEVSERPAPKLPQTETNPIGEA